MKTQKELATELGSITDHGKILDWLSKNQDCGVVLRIDHGWNQILVPGGAIGDDSYSVLIEPALSSSDALYCICEKLGIRTEEA